MDFVYDAVRAAIASNGPAKVFVEKKGSGMGDDDIVITNIPIADGSLRAHFTLTFYCQTAEAFLKHGFVIFNVMVDVKAKDESDDDDDPCGVMFIYNNCRRPLMEPSVPGVTIECDSPPELSSSIMDEVALIASAMCSAVVKIHNEDGQPCVAFAKDNNVRTDHRMLVNEENMRRFVRTNILGTGAAAHAEFLQECASL